MSKDVIIACDFSSKAELLTFLDKFTDSGLAEQIRKLL